ncbi:M15 family metallopeptidase [Natronosporangium hydrolyticum]|uniref:M15 family metallopeptidase n=1 Tax=Natronosporangium hydrolyticum TaxID=2811111 RepID=A0A895YIH6_9ACTN|nr:M15 family metallopeptidase [Natronosporangium hydrolyticum]QSB15815.1 M15 family metallopeptidase [Natronosporangium hydrolyticum]
MRVSAGRRGVLGLLAGLLLAGAGCGIGEPPTDDGPTTPPASPSPSPDDPPNNATAEPSDDATAAEPARPDWLGTRPLPERPDGLGEVQDTPPELVDRQLPPPDAEPVADVFEATITDVPEPVAARSTWTSECPVTLAELRYLTMTFWGFDGRSYAGEMIVHRSVAEDVVAVFDRIYQAGFPIEEMRVVAATELTAPPTGDGNNTSGFACRPTTLSTQWSQHAYGLAIDINPFHNPYRRDDAVAPELASAYLDRDHHRPGMIQPNDEVTRAFAEIGWGWGGEWSSLDDWMHFSQSGR